MKNNKFKRIYNIFFIILALMPILLLTFWTIGALVDINTGPYDKRDKYIGLAVTMLGAYTLFVLVGIFGLYSSLKYFLFEQKKKLFKTLWNIVLLPASAFFLLWLISDFMACI